MSKEAEQSKALTILKIFKILSIIGKVCCIVGISGIVLGMIAITAVGANTKKTDESITIFGEEFKYYANDENKLVIEYDGDDYEVYNENDSNPLNLDGKEAVKIINKTSICKLIILLDTLLVYCIVILVFTILIINKLISIFEIIIKEETPFVDTVPSYLLQISHLVAYEFIAQIVFVIVISEVFSDSIDLTINFEQVLICLAFYVLSWCVAKGNNKKTIKKVKTKKIKE